MTASFFNNGKTSVGVQAGEIHGPVNVARGDQSVTTNTADLNWLREQLEELRQQLDLAAAREELDAELLPVTRASLAVAERAVASPDGLDRSRLISSLEAIRGAGQGISSITEAVSTIVRAVGNVL